MEGKAELSPLSTAAILTAFVVLIFIFLCFLQPQGLSVGLVIGFAIGIVFLFPLFWGIGIVGGKLKAQKDAMARDEILRRRIEQTEREVANAEGVGGSLLVALLLLPVAAIGLAWFEWDMRLVLFVQVLLLVPAHGLNKFVLAPSVKKAASRQLERDQRDLAQLGESTVAPQARAK